MNKSAGGDGGRYHPKKIAIFYKTSQLSHFLAHMPVASPSFTFFVCSRLFSCFPALSFYSKDGSWSKTAGFPVALLSISSSPIFFLPNSLWVSDLFSTWNPLSSPFNLLYSLPLNLSPRPSAVITRTDPKTTPGSPFPRFTILNCKEISN